MRRLIPSLLALPFTAPALEAQERPAADSTRRLPAVTVTATRDSGRSVLDAPMAVTVLRRDDFAFARGAGIDGALGAVPGVLAQSRAGGTDVRLTIRGFGARGAGDRSNAGTSRGVRILLDGIPETEPDGRTAFDNIDLAAAEGIDVVRSNASALWGNAAGGVVNVSTVPSFGRGYGAVQTMAGSYGLRRWIAQGGTRLGAARGWATVVRTDVDGWRAQSGSDRTLFSAGVLAPLGPADAPRTTLGAFVSAADNAFDIPGPLSQAQLDTDPSQANPTYLQRRERRHNRVARLGVTVDHRVGEEQGVSGMVFVNPKYLQRSERGTYRDFTRQHFGGNALWRLGGALSSSVRHRLTVGGDGAYQDGAVLFYSLSPEGERGSELRTNKAEGALNLGAFAQEELDIGDRLTLSLGARLDRIEYDYRDYVTPTLDARKRFQRLSPKLGALWRLGAGHTVYANVGGGIEAPAGNETDPASTYGQDTVTAINPLLEPIRSTTYEVGTKRVVAPSAGVVRGASYDVALYLTDVRDEIVPYRGGRFYFTAGRARRSGAEIGVDAQLAGGLALRAAATVSRNEYRDYVVDSVHYGRPGAAADYSGNRVVGVPDWFASGEVTWAPRPLARAGLRARAGVQSVGRYWADDANTVDVPAYTTASVGLGVDRPRQLGAFTLRGFVSVENVFDRGHVASAFLNPDVVNGVPLAFEPGLPRNVVVSLSVSRGR